MTHPDSPEFDAYADDYDDVVRRGLSVSGESRDFFARRRVDHVRRSLDGRVVGRILDFGCGDGATSLLLAAAFPDADVVGSDVSPRSIARARAVHSAERIRFLTGQELAQLADWRADVVYTNGVFHHIRPPDRNVAFQQILGVLARDGTLALWENNPWNPGARIVMRRIPFDRDAIPLSPRVAWRLVHAQGLTVQRTDFLFYFPRALAFLRRTEPLFRRLPFGAQYCVLCTRSS